MPEWIDFKTLRKGLSFDKVLDFYGIEIKRRQPGNRHQGFCPLPTHQGKKRSPSFSAKLDLGVWQCFGCKARGNVLDFAVRMEGLDPENHQDLRKVALKLQDHFKIPGAAEPKAKRVREGRAESQAKPDPSPKPSLPVLVNPPLDFQLKDLDPDHPYLKNRGFTQETIRHFGLGYCNRGLMKGRIAIPLHDQEGKLIGYAGRLVDDAAVDAEHPKYLLPGSRERGGKLHQFQKSHFLYHAHRFSAVTEDLVVVEGFPAVWWLWQHGHRHVVGLMGSSCSAQQAKLALDLVHRTGRIWILTDGDVAGHQCGLSLLEQLSPERLCRWVRLDDGKQPTDCDADWLSLRFV